MRALRAFLITSDLRSETRMPPKPQAATMLTAYSAVAAPRSVRARRAVRLRAVRRQRERRRRLLLAATNELDTGTSRGCEAACPDRLLRKMPLLDALFHNEFRAVDEAIRRRAGTGSVRRRSWGRSRAG